MSGVTYQVSHVRCHISLFMCNVPCVMCHELGPDSYCWHYCWIISNIADNIASNIAESSILLISNIASNIAGNIADNIADQKFWQKYCWQHCWNFFFMFKTRAFYIFMNTKNTATKGIVWFSKIIFIFLNQIKIGCGIETPCI